LHDTLEIEIAGDRCARSIESLQDFRPLPHGVGQMAAHLGHVDIGIDASQ
jgi:hypothetical protein